MERSVATRLKLLGPNLGLTGVIVTLAVGVILPVVLATGVGIVSLAFSEDTSSFVIGILVISFAAASIGGAVTATVLLGRKARTARLQADFLANMSHELRTPLASIRMYAQTLQTGQLELDPQRTGECLATIIRETRWLDGMVDSVLTWRTASKDQSVLELRTAPLADAVNDALQRFSGLTSPGEVELITQIETEAVVAHDRNGIAMVLLNLLVNAYRYTRADKRIEVRAHDEDGQVLIEVEDNGIGIPLTERHRIFDAFYRVDTRLRSKSSGAGLGLAIVRSIVRAHQGEIDLRSKRGEGSCFTVRLPVAQPDEVPTDAGEGSA